MEISIELKEALDNLSMSEELKALEYIFKKYNLSTISDYAIKNNISRQSIYNAIELSRMANIQLAGQTFIIN